MELVTRYLLYAGFGEPPGTPNVNDLISGFDSPEAAQRVVQVWREFDRRAGRRPVAWAEIRPDPKPEEPANDRETLIALHGKELPASDAWVWRGRYRNRLEEDARALGQALWETEPDWAWRVVQPVYDSPMAPRHALRILQVAGELISQGASYLDILEAMTRAVPPARQQSSDVLGEIIEEIEREHGITGSNEGGNRG